MNDKKNIDRLFQEKFKDFEAKPNDQVWANIEAELKKKERKVIPFWIQFSGIAAAFILGLFTLNMIFESNTEINKGIVLDTKTLKNKSVEKETITNQVEKEKSRLQIKNNQQVLVPHSKNNSNNEKEITIVISSQSYNEKKNKNNTKIHFSKNNTPIKYLAKGVATSNYKPSISEKTNTSDSNSIEKTINQTIENKEFEEKKGSAIAAIKTNNEPSITSESTNELEEILKKKEAGKKTLAPSNSKKWQIVPNVAAVYLNSNSGGSSIDARFSENQKTSDKSLSYGIGVNYAVSKKFVLRTGLNKLTLGYNTNDVVYSSGLSINNIANINYGSKPLIEVQNQSTLSTLSPFEKDLQKTNTGSINQKMGYYEVPLELSYSILNKRFGLNIIGGISTLLLNQNKIAIISSNTNVTLGEANNLNAIHFSTNVGLGLKYQLVKSFQFNFEPMLKYQLNTYSKDSGNYKPVFIGLYSGIIYNF